MPKRQTTTWEGAHKVYNPRTGGDPLLQRLRELNHPFPQKMPAR